MKPALFALTASSALIAGAAQAQQICCVQQAPAQQICCVAQQQAPDGLRGYQT